MVVFALDPRYPHVVGRAESRAHAVARKRHGHHQEHRLREPRREIFSWRRRRPAKDLQDLFATAKFLKDDGTEDTTPKHKFNFDQNFYSIVFTAKNPAAKDPEPVRVLIIPAKYADYYKASGVTNIQLGAATLPGVDKLFDVFLTNDEDATAGTTYTYIEVEDPLHAQLLAASKLVNFGDIASSLLRIRKAREGREKAAGEKISDVEEVAYFAITEIDIPVTRATLTAKTATDSGDIPQKKI
ncbi:MAG TPA: hypothetical protein VM733_15295, partial [Thermoanaerobaculia bacterium]|nr:hypothetical protein [Thermoanaerobaculia bacterium]